MLLLLLNCYSRAWPKKIRKKKKKDGESTFTMGKSNKHYFCQAIKVNINNEMSG